jgi:hypothetical protein
MGEGTDECQIRERVALDRVSALYRYAMHPRRRWVTSNPCDMIDLPPLAISDEIRFLTTAEVDALWSAAGRADRAALAGCGLGRPAGQGSSQPRPR